MKIKEIRLGKTFNMGNYESLSIELMAEIEENEDVQISLRELSEEINKYRTNH